MVGEKSTKLGNCLWLLFSPTNHNKNIVGDALLKHQQWRTKQRIAGADACNGEKSLIYFNDSEEQETPLMFDEITWDQVKKNIVDAHLDYLNNY